MERLNNNKHLSSQLKVAIVGLYKQSIPHARIDNQQKLKKKQWKGGENGTRQQITSIKKL